MAGKSGLDGPLWASAQRQPAHWNAVENDGILRNNFHFSLALNNLDDSFVFRVILATQHWGWDENATIGWQIPPVKKDFFALFFHITYRVSKPCITLNCHCFLLARDHFEVKNIRQEPNQDVWSEKSASSSSSIIIVEHTQWGTDVKPPWSPDQGETIDRKLVTYVEIEKVVWYFISLE